jgi:hypothetical protein
LKRAAQFIGVGLASFAIGAVCTFLLVRHTGVVAKTWFPLSTDGGGVSFNLAVFIIDIPMPTIGRPEGRAKFLDRESGIDLGYVIKLPIKPLAVSTLPEKYRKTTKMDNGLEIGPPDQVGYTGHFEFTLKDADGFVLMTVSSPQENLSAGQDNTVQGETKDSISSSIAEHTKSIVARFIVESCSPCEAK